MGIQNNVSKLWLSGALALLGLVVFFSADGLAYASDEEGSRRGVGKNALREQYCVSQSGDHPSDCGSFCFWAICLECPQCCPCGDSACNPSDQQCVGGTGGMSCAEEVCEPDDPVTGEPGDCNCEGCGSSVDCPRGCCHWEWRMYGQNQNVNSKGRYTVSFGERAENTRLEAVIDAALEEPSDIQDCLSDRGGAAVGRRNESIGVNEGTVPTATVLYTPEWYGTRVPVEKPRRLPVGAALHAYPGESGAPVLDGVDQDNQTCGVRLLTSAPWNQLQYRMWPYDGRIPSDRLPGAGDPGRGANADGVLDPARALPQASQIVQWTDVPANGRLCEPTLQFIYEMSNFAGVDPNATGFDRPLEIGNDGDLYPGSQAIVQRNFYDWALYTFQLRWKDPDRADLTSNTVNVMLHLGVPGGSNPCPANAPEGTVCGFRVNDPVSDPLPLLGVIGEHETPATGAAEPVAGRTWLHPGLDWQYPFTSSTGIYGRSALIRQLAQRWDAYRVVSPEVRPMVTTNVYVAPNTGDQDVELQIGSLGGDLQRGWVDIRYWPHSGTSSSQVLDHKWYSLGRVQGQTIRLERDYGAPIRCWQYRSDNFANVGACGVDEDAQQQNTESLMPFTNAEYEVFRDWRTWAIQARVVALDIRGEFLYASSPSAVVTVKLGDPPVQAVQDGVTLPVVTDPNEPHSSYGCGYRQGNMADRLVDRYGNLIGTQTVDGTYNCDVVEPFEAWIDVELDHPGAASDDAGALDPGTPGSVVPEDPDQGDDDEHVVF